MDDAMSEAPRLSILMRTPPFVLALVGVLMGCVMDAVIKHLGESYNAVVIGFWRYAFGTLVSGAVVLALRLKLPDGRGLRRHALRAVASTGSAILFFHCITILPIAEATVLIFCAPLLIPPLARWILGEKFRGIALAALVIGFFGMIITVQGEAAGAVDPRRMEGIISGVGASMLYALSIVLLRQLAQKDDVTVTAFLGNVFPTIYLLVPALILGPGLAPVDIPVFAFTGFAGFALWYMLTQAYSRAPAQTLAAAEYSGLIWSAALGYFFFAEVPRWQIWVGAAVIVAAVMLAAWDSHRRGKAQIVAD
jgi:S-adenosylmethionine uptake transporter